MLSKPIEVVVIRRPASLALPAASESEVSDQKSQGSAELTSDLPSAPLHPPSPPELSPDQQRELDAQLEALHCPVRQRILLTFAATEPARPPWSAGTGGHAGVGGTGQSTALEARLGIADKTIGHHLAHLRTAGRAGYLRGFQPKVKAT